MNPQQESLETLREIRTIMERSSKFISLSGLSGVIAGLSALVGVAIAYWYLGLAWNEPGYYRLATLENGMPNMAFYQFALVDALSILFVSLLFSLWLTRSTAQQQGQPIWDTTAKRLLINLLIPLVVGGIFCCALLYQHQVALVAPATLLFYGLALMHASKYTLPDVRYLGIAQVLVGLLASFFVEYGLLFWGFGFGILHILYGTRMFLNQK